MRKRGETCDKRSQKRCTIPEVFDDEDEVVRGEFFCVGCMGTFSVTEGNRHHVVEHADGGLSERWNCIMTCASCHVTLHNGTRKDQTRIFRRLYAYMGSLYGLLFLLQYPANYEGMKRDMVENAMTLGDIREANESIKSQMDNELMHQFAPGTLYVGNNPYVSMFLK